MNKLLEQTDLWNEAIQGDEKSLMKLYNMSVHCFKRDKFRDATGLNDHDDFVSIATTLFFSIWKRWDSSRGILFVSWMFLAIHNKLKTVQNLSFSSKRHTNEGVVSFTDIPDDSLFINYFVQSDDELVSYYRSRIENYMTNINAPEESISIFRLKVFNSEFNIRQIANILCISVTSAYRYFNILKVNILSFLNYEKSLFYDVSSMAQKF